MPDNSSYLQPGKAATRKTAGTNDYHHCYVTDDEGQTWHYYAEDGGEWSVVQLPAIPIPVTG